MHLPAAVWEAFSPTPSGGGGSGGGADLLHNSKKGPVVTTATLAGVMAAKRTADLIPLCHPLPLEDCRVDITRQPGEPGSLRVDCRVATTHKTGVEMEALTGKCHSRAAAAAPTL